MSVLEILALILFAPVSLTGGVIVGLLLGIFLPDPNRLTAKDREIMAREQAEADAAERREVGQ